MTKYPDPRRYKHLATNADIQIELDEGELVRVAINTKGLSSNTLTLRDGLDNNAPVIAILDTTVDVGSFEFHVHFRNGLRASMSTGTAADITIVWQVVAQKV